MSTLITIIIETVIVINILLCIKFAVKAGVIDAVRELTKEQTNKPE